MAKTHGSFNKSSVLNRTGFQWQSIYGKEDGQFQLSQSSLQLTSNGNPHNLNAGQRTQRGYSGKRKQDLMNDLNDDIFSPWEENANSSSFIHLLPNAFQIKVEQEVK